MELRSLTTSRSLVGGTGVIPSEQDVYATAFLGRAIAAGTGSESYEIRISGDTASRDDAALRQMLGLYQRRSGH